MQSDFLVYDDGPVDVYAPQHTHPHPSFTPNAGTIVFTSDNSGDAQIFEASRTSAAEYLSKWTPRRSLRRAAEPWEKETEDDWKDSRFLTMQKGPVISCSTRLRDRYAEPKNICIRHPGDAGVWSMFDTARCVLTTAHEGSQVNFSPARFGILRMPELAGDELFYVDARQAWRIPGEDGDSSAAMDPGDLRFGGYHRHKDGIVLEYSVLGADFQESMGRFNPKDGHLYVCGLDGWQTAARTDGSLQRVCYTGDEFCMPIELHAEEGALRIGFTQPLDPDSARDLANYAIEQWQYRWSSDYGSPELSIRSPGRIGHDEVTIHGVDLSDDGQTVRLLIPELKPVMQMRVEMNVAAKGNSRQRHVIHNTIHKLAAP